MRSPSSNFGWALLAALVVAAVSVVLAVLLGSDGMGSIRTAQRIARRQGIIDSTDVPGIVYLEIDGLAKPVLRRAMRDGNAPNMARWARETHRLAEWETDLSSQTGASQAGILLGSNEDISAFRWVEKETATMMTCSAPGDCAELERRLGSGIGLLVDGGASRGNLLSGEAQDVILTVSRMDAEKRSQSRLSRVLRERRQRDAHARPLRVGGHPRVGGRAACDPARRAAARTPGRPYPPTRGALCVFVRDLIVSGVLTDMMRADDRRSTRPSRAMTRSRTTLASSVPTPSRRCESWTTTSADIERACRYAPRPYEIVVLSDHGQTQGATFKQRNGYGLDELVERSLARGDVSSIEGGDEQHSMVGLAVSEATGTTSNKKRPKNDVSDRDVVVLGSGNLGLIYLMEERRRLTMEEIDERHPELLPALRSHPHVGWLLVRSSQHGAVALGADGTYYLAEGRVEGKVAGEFLTACTEAPAPHRRLRARRRHHGRELLRPGISRRRLRLRGADLVPRRHRRAADETVHPPPDNLQVPTGPILGAASVHGILAGWRHELQRRRTTEAATAEQTATAAAAEERLGAPG